CFKFKHEIFFVKQRNKIKRKEISNLKHSLIEDNLSAMVYPKLEKEFYNGEDVVQLSRELLGKFLFTQVGGILTGGMIVETEAYNGRCDKACHANDNRRTKRTEVM